MEKCKVGENVIDEIKGAVFNHGFHEIGKGTSFTQRHNIIMSGVFHATETVRLLIQTGVRVDTNLLDPRKELP